MLDITKKKHKADDPSGTMGDLKRERAFESQTANTP